MVLIVGLGNPGAEYERTRHNAGFMVLDTWLAKLAPGATWSSHSKSSSLIYKTDQMVLAKPQTFMNDSGRAVQSLMQFFQVTELDQVWIIHDDLDIPLGSFKIQLGTGPKIHNGLGSIYQALGSENFWHVRIGVDNRNGDRSLPGQAYVLQRLTVAEAQVLEGVIDQIIARLEKEVQS